MADKTEPTMGPAAGNAASGIGATAKRVADRVSDVMDASKTGSAAKESVDTLKKLGRGVKGAAQGAKEMFVGGGKGAAGAVGGIVGGTVGLADSIGGKAIRMMNAVGNGIGGFAGKYKKTTALGVMLAAAVAVKGWLDKRGKQAELNELEKRNELSAATMSNMAAESRLNSMPDLNPEARADFVQKYGSRQAGSQQAGL